MPRAAREHVRVARRLPELPLTHAAFARGELSYAKVRALTRVATAENEQELLEWPARPHQPSWRDRARLPARLDGRGARAAGGCLPQPLLEPGRVAEVHGRLAPEDGALLLRALEAQRDSLWRDGGRGSAEPRPARQASNAEALVALADAALAHTRARAAAAASATSVVVHADEAVLAHDGEGGCELKDGSAVAPETARRLACDASLVRTADRSRDDPFRAPTPSGGATAAAVSPRLREPPLRRHTTSSIGRTEARQPSTTSCSSAAATTVPSTKAATASTR